MDSRFRGNDDYLTTADGTSDYDHNRVRAAVTAVGGAGTQHLAARHACPHAVRLYWVSALPAPALPEIDHYEEIVAGRTVPVTFGLISRPRVQGKLQSESLKTRHHPVATVRF